MKRLTAVLVGCWLSTSACSSSKSTPMAAADAGSDAADSAVDAFVGDTAIRTVEADDTEHLLYSGRIDFTDPKAPTFSAPGVLVAAKFTGISVSVMLTDAFKGSNYADVVVDGTPYKIKPARSTEFYPVVSDLPYGEHTVEFTKRTEASQGQMTFKGFQFGGTLLPAPTRPDRRIEIIGDSISCGSGDEASNGTPECTDNYGLAYENAYVTYGAVLARNLAAEYYITAVSGIGAMRHYECNNPNTMPVVYDRLFLEQTTSPAWDTSKFQPDAIIVALGTNDFSPASCNRPPLSPACDPTNYQLFIDTLKEFVGTTLRGYYPNAHVFLTSSPLLGDGWPSPVTIGDGGTDDAGTDAAGPTCAYTSRTSHIAALGTVVSDLTAAGDSKVHLVDMVPKVAGGGCSGHPTAKDHANIGGNCASNAASCQDYLLNPVKQIMGW